MNGLIAFSQRFSTPDECLVHIESVRWEKGEFCPKCGSTEKIYHYQKGV